MARSHRVHRLCVVGKGERGVGGEEIKGGERERGSNMWIFFFEFVKEVTVRAGGGRGRWGWE